MTVCAWCDDVIEQPLTAQAARELSHGICRSCLIEELTKLRPTVAPAPLHQAEPARG